MKRKLFCVIATGMNNEEMGFLLFLKTVTWRDPRQHKLLVSQVFY